MAATGNELVKLSQLKGTVDAIKTKIDGVEDDIPEVIDSVTSTSTVNALSARIGKELNDRIQNLASIGKYLAMWDCTTGLPTTNPVSLPYSYTTGDYYIISNLGATNYMPNGATYIGTASTTQYSGTETLAIGDFWYYDGTIWSFMKNTGKTASFATLAGSPMDNSNLAAALNAKQDVIIDLTTIRTNASNAVQKTGNETVGGSKTFTDNLTIANGTNQRHIALGNGGKIRTNSTGDLIISSKDDSAVYLRTTGDVGDGVALNAFAFYPEQDASAQSNKDLGTPNYKWRYVYARTINQNGKQVANAEDIPTSVNGLSGGTITSTTTINGAMKIAGRYTGSGDDEGLIIDRAPNNYAGVILGNPTGNRVVLYLKSDNTGCIRYNDGSTTTSYDIIIPSKAGTMAVTSDIPTSVNGLSGGTITSATKVNGSLTTQKWKQETDSSNNLVFTYVG